MQLLAARPGPAQIWFGTCILITTLRSMALKTLASEVTSRLCSLRSKLACPEPVNAGYRIEMEFAGLEAPRQ